MAYLFSSESVSEGHPDKVSDQISDALVDQFLAYDDEAHCAIETFVTTGQVVIMGEVRSQAYIDLQTVARNTIKKIGYTKSEYQFDGDSCGVLTAIHEQSDDINRGVSRAVEEEQGAGDQGMMFGYATNETENYMPVSLDLSHLLMKTLADIRKEGKEMTYLRPDSKSQVTVEYSDQGEPLRIDTIVVSTQHDDFDSDDTRMLAKIKEDVMAILMPRVKAQISSERPCSTTTSNTLSTPQASLLSAVRTEIRGLQAGKSSSIPMAARVHTGAEPSREKTPVRWIARLPTPHGISLRIWWLRVWPTKCWCR